MKKAKTKKNLISILIATLGVVFAFITGVTYCISSFTLEYGMRPNSTSAYMANQQYHLINDTVDQPVIFGEGSRNFEIALQYSMPYDFDVRLEYSLTWSGGGSATNVILHFANRDNIIYDENYIYIAESIPQGDGKVGIITGVDFTNIKDTTYDGQSLTINITDVKIYKKQQPSGYSLAGHLLTKYVQSSVAAQAWIFYKNRDTGTNSYVMMYNPRGKHETGVPYPGLETAYKKPVSTVNVGEVSGPSWLGGNRSYAGVGMYVIAGASTLKINIEVAGIWRTEGDAGGIIDASPQLISENSIKFNYTKDWTHEKWDDLKLWETRNYNFVIPAKTACYINILDSVEVTSASRVTSNLYDKYRAVVNSVHVNSNLGSQSTKFEYTEADAQRVSIKQINNNAGLSTSVTYSKPNVSVVNSSLYSCGLYSAHVGKAAEEQYFKTNVSLINNTNTTQNIKVDFTLKCLISNGSTVLTKDYDDGSGGTIVLRADEMLGGLSPADEDFLTPLSAFKQNLYYAYEMETESIDETTTKHSIVSINRTVSPYSSISVLETFSAIADLQDEIKRKFSPDEATHYYDVWVFLEVTISAGSHTFETSQPTDTTKELNKTSLIIESDWNIDKTKVIFSVKNPSNKIIYGAFIKAFSGQELSAPIYTAVTTKPSDWDASYWQYYLDNNGTKEQYTVNNGFNPGNTYKKEQGYSVDYGLNTYTSGTYSFAMSGKNFTSTNLVLQPGESATFASIDLYATDEKIYFSGEAYSEVAKKVTDEIAYVNEGKINAFLINNSENSYYVRFSGNLSAVPSTIFTDGGYNYYMGIIRPGQILSLQTTTIGNLDAIEIEADGVFNTDTLETWSEAAKQKMTKYFAFVKT